MTKKFWDAQLAKSMPNYVKGMSEGEYNRVLVYNTRAHFFCCWRYAFGQWPSEFYKSSPELIEVTKEMYQDLQAIAHHAGT